MKFGDLTGVFELVADCSSDSSDSSDRPVSRCTATTRPGCDGGASDARCILRWIIDLSPCRDTRFVSMRK